MASRNTCVAVYPACSHVTVALQGLREAGCDLGLVSVLGQARVDAEQAVGFFRSGGRFHYHGPQAAFWQALGGLLNTTAVVRQSEAVLLIVVGHLAAVMMRETMDSEVGGGFSLHGAALHTIGIPRDGIIEYEQAVQNENLLLLVHGAHEEVEQACSVLHSEHQQVTVHVG